MIRQHFDRFHQQQLPQQQNYHQRPVPAVPSLVSIAAAVAAAASSSPQSNLGFFRIIVECAHPSLDIFSSFFTMYMQSEKNFDTLVFAEKYYRKSEDEFLAMVECCRLHLPHLPTRADVATIELCLNLLDAFRGEWNIFVFEWGNKTRTQAQAYSTRPAATYSSSPSPQAAAVTFSFPSSEIPNRSDTTCLEMHNF